MRYRCPRLCALVLLASLPACFKAAPTEFSNLAALTSYEKEDGFAMIDHFGDGWPAKIDNERVYRDKAVVILADGEAYNFEGPKLKVVHLTGEHSAEIVVVYRSQDKG
jgi:glyoxylase-like metal-dependent hydrolase (beta-lactamase superfamily II)